MSTDRELLELAAKAAGYEWSAEIAEQRNKIGLAALWIKEVSTSWDPINNDGQALRLAVKLQFESGNLNGASYAMDALAKVDIREPHNGDPYAATRRAIVLAAAALARAAGEGEKG